MPSSRVSISQYRDTSVVIYLCVIYLLATFCRQPTLRSESRGCLHTLPSREEEKPPSWWIKKWHKNRAVTIFGVIRENFLKRMHSHFYFVKRSPFFNANFLVCPFPEKLPAAFASDRWSDLRLFPCVSNSAQRKFVDEGRRVGG